MESLLQEQVANYLRYRYPGVLFRSDLGGVRLTMGQAARMRRVQVGRGWPDMVIAARRGRWGALYIELKREGTAIYKRDGELVANAHLREQAATLRALRAEGYAAVFGVGYQATIEIIDAYLNTKTEGSNEIAGSTLCHL